jgi:amidase
VLGRAYREGDLEPAMHDGYLVGKTLDAVTYLQAIQQIHAVGRAMQGVLKDADILLTPTLTVLPPPLGWLEMKGTLQSFRELVSTYATFLAVINASGQPAASVPIDCTESGLPLAIQLVGQFGREDQVLKLSAQLEEAAPWASRRPVFPTSGA